MSSLVNGGLPFLGTDPDLGLSRHKLRELERLKLIRRQLRGVYVDSRVPDSVSIRALGLHLVKPEHAVFFGNTVTYLLGLDTRRPGDRFDFVPQCLVPHHSTRCTSRLVKCFEGYVEALDVTVIEGLEVTTPVRTTVDLLRKMKRPYALAAADAMANAGHITVEEIVDYIAPMRHYPGIIQARSLAPFIEPRTESPGESWQRLRLIDAGFPRPQAQFVVTSRRGRGIARLDLAYVEMHIGLEYDGAVDHSEDEDVEHDDNRRSPLTGIYGWRLAVSHKDDILGDDPALEIEVGGWLGIEPLLPRLW